MYKIEFYESKTGKSEIITWFRKILADKNGAKLAKQRYRRIDLI